MDKDILIEQDLTFLELKCKVEKEKNDEDINDRLGIFDTYKIDNSDLENLYIKTKEEDMRTSFYVYDDDGHNVTMARQEIQKEYKKRKTKYIKELTKTRNKTY